VKDKKPKLSMATTLFTVRVGSKSRTGVQLLFILTCGLGPIFLMFLLQLGVCKYNTPKKPALECFKPAYLAIKKATK